MGQAAEPNLAQRTELTQEELLRYSRHLILPDVGVRGQARLKASSALIVGAGGLGSPVALYLAAAGVGRIGLVDFDRVDESNLQRQILYGVDDVGKSKLAAAKRRLQDLNPHVVVETHEVALSSDNAREIIRGYDVVADGTDNFQTRYLVNDACVMEGVPNVYASIFRFEGQVSVFGTDDGPCYRCLYAQPPPPGLVPSCAEGGVLGVLPGIVGSMQANEVLKLLLGAGQPLAGRLLLFDALAMEFTTVQVARNRECPLCGDHPSLTQLVDYEEFCGVGAADPEPIPVEHRISAVGLKARLDDGESVFVLDVREPGETEVSAIAGSVNIPVQELGSRVAEVPRDRPVVVHCKSGYRSAQAWHQLRDAGFEQVWDLSGGILAWGRDVDSTQFRY